MSETGSAFEHSTPALYDRLMGPVLFEPYAQLVAGRSALLRPARVLETAAGTGILTRSLTQAVPEAQIVATDVNELNPVPKAAGDALDELFSDDPPRYMERGPFSYADPELVERDLRAAGFADVELDTVSLSSRVTARDAAQGMVLGSPFRAEIERRAPDGLDQAVDAVTEALRPWNGQDAPMSAHVATATR